jgi:hypothetical protein
MKNFGKLMGVIFTAIIAGLLMGYPIMWLWNNCLVPAVPVICPIDFWQAIGLKFLLVFLSHRYEKNTTISEKK